MSDTAGAFLLGAGAGLLASAVVAFVWARTRRRPGTVEDPGRRADLTSKIGHELKNPVMSVKGLASSGIRLYPSMSDDERLEFFRLIDVEANRLKLIADEISTAGASAARAPILRPWRPAATTRRCWLCFLWCHFLS